MPRLFLLDGSNAAFRAHFAQPPRHTSDGFPTRVLYGFLLLFERMLRSWKPDYVAVSFDRGSTFRHDLYAAYKGHRPEMPEDLRQQWPLLTDLVEAFGYTSITVDGFEADDVLGTLARRFAGPDLEVFLVTSDKDFCQIVDDHISILDDMKGTVIDVAGVFERWGVEPSRVIDVLGLCGDASDNIPGVTKIGEKTAIKLVIEHGSLEGALTAAREGRVKGAVGQRLVEEAEAARLSYTLATIVTDVSLPHTLEDLRPRGIDPVKARELFDKWEFGLVARKLLPEQEQVDLGVYRTATASEVAPALLGEPLAFAVGLEDGEARGIAVCPPGGTSTWIPFADLVGRALAQSWLAGPAAKVGHGTKGALHTFGPGSIGGLIGDTRLLDYLLTPYRKSHELEDQASRHLGHTLGMSSRGLSGEEAIAARAAEQAAVVARLHERLDPRLEEGPRWVYHNIELPLIPVLVGMERAGIKLDVSRIGEVDADIAGRLEEVERQCQELAGKTFNLRSRHELRDVLFIDLGLPATKKVKDGWSTDSDVLEKLADRHALPAKVLEYRALDKLRGTYLTKLPTYVRADGRIHSTFQQEVAATGRLSSIDPNLQNIPVRTFEGRRIRECFVPEAGQVFLSADYSQVELRILAHFTDDPVLTAGFVADEDIHRRTAVEVFKIAPGEVTLAHRSAAKAINFGLIYGMSAFRLAGDLQIPQTEAQRYMDEYFARMPAVLGWIEETRKFAHAHGWVETLYGRRRIIPEIHAALFNDRMAAEREAVNTRIQGTAADIIKIAMLRVQAALEVGRHRARMLLQVHDELLLEVPVAEVEVVTALVRREMEGAAALKVPLKVNTSVGHNWNEAHG